jgi:hypothetical protein
LRALQGEDIGKLPRFPDGMSEPAMMREADRSLKAQRASERGLREWLARRGSMLDR